MVTVMRFGNTEKEKGCVHSHEDCLKVVRLRWRRRSVGPGREKVERNDSHGDWLRMRNKNRGEGGESAFS